ncbi:MAG: APC family permease [Alphaproteobacteria bacterium]|jgi:amino acid transporter|nr:APC family permease [Rhodospirillaceae bacterium]MBT6511893.1 APC family permease [Rhodospirillaceae bacterium]MBT7612872.1 APC family permease [Rhodospirillaceae bacterium]MDG2479711.1 APC family permease [Alphaproteobacteria bacterium]
MALQRRIGVLGLTMIGVGGVIGSGWLFAPMHAANLAGPAAIISWMICGVAVLMIALTYAEVCGRLPVAGGIGRLPYFTHGRLVAAAMGWTAWVGYLTTAPIETAVMLQYLAQPLPWLTDGSKAHGLSPVGMIFAVVLLGSMTLINALGVAFFARLNSGLTIFKVIIPILVGVLIIADRFSGANFSSEPEFMPYGWKGVLSAIATGGVLFAFLGFRHVIDMAGEVHNPKVTIPLGLVFSVLVCLGIYLFLQIVFIGALTGENLQHGWAAFTSDHELGPLSALAIALGMVWLSGVVLAGAVVAPFGGALISTGSNARLTLALAHNGFFPSLMAKLSSRQIPLNALLLNFVIGSVMFLVLPFGEIVALNGAALVFSLTVGPVTLLALRRQSSEAFDSFRLPAAVPLCVLAFAVSTLIVYWSGWDTVWRLGVAIAVGAVLLFARQFRSDSVPLHIRPSLWLVPYIAGLLLLSAFGSFGGTGLIPFGLDMVLGTALSVFCLYLAIVLRLPDESAAAHRADIDGSDLGVKA